MNKTTKQNLNYFQLLWKKVCKSMLIYCKVIFINFIDLFYFFNLLSLFQHLSTFQIGCFLKKIFY